MKKFIRICQFSVIVFLVSLNASAQNNTAPEAKTMNTDKALNPASKKTTVSEIKTPEKPIVLPLQKAESPNQVTPAEPVITRPAEQKTFEIRPNAYKWDPKNMDRPKTATTYGLKKTDPVQIPVKAVPAKPNE